MSQDRFPKKLFAELFVMHHEFNRLTGEYDGVAQLTPDSASLKCPLIELIRETNGMYSWEKYSQERWEAFWRENKVYLTENRNCYSASVDIHLPLTTFERFNTEGINGWLNVVGKRNRVVTQIATWCNNESGNLVDRSLYLKGENLYCRCAYISDSRYVLGVISKIIEVISEPGFLMVASAKWASSQYSNGQLILINQKAEMALAQLKNVWDGSAKLRSNNPNLQSVMDSLRQIQVISSY